MYLVILAFDNLNFRQWAVRYKAIRHIFLSLREDPPMDPPNKDTSINFTPSQILEGQYVLVSFSTLYYSIKIQRLWPDLKHEKC